MSSDSQKDPCGVAVLSCTHHLHQHGRMAKSSFFHNLVFLSGGTALHGISSYLGYQRVLYSYGSAQDGYMREEDEISSCLFHTTHIITCFDSGGSSAILRDVLISYPAVGDLRNRICSIAQGMYDACQTLGITNDRVTLVHLCKHRLPNEIECREMKLSSIDLGDILTTFSQFLNHPQESFPEFPNATPCHNLFSQLLQLVENTSLDLKCTCGSYLQSFLNHLSENYIVFNYCNASIGNLILTGAYLRNDNKLETAILNFCHLLGIYTDDIKLDRELPIFRVLPASSEPLTIGAHLQSSEYIIGQHAVTSPKGSHQGLSSPIQSIFLVDYHSNMRSQPSTLPEEKYAIASIEAILSLESAHIICYSIGSFFTSMIASLLPTGIATAIRLNGTARKVFIPNMVFDPEMVGLSLHETTGILIRTLQKYDINSNHSTEESTKFLSSNYVSIVILDHLSLTVTSSLSFSSPIPPNIPYSHFGSYQEILKSAEILRNEMGIIVLEADICSYSDEKLGKIEINPSKFLKTLKSLS